MLTPAILLVMFLSALTSFVRNILQIAQIWQSIDFSKMEDACNATCENLKGRFSKLNFGTKKAETNGTTIEVNQN